MGLRDSCYSPVTNSLSGGNLRDLERIQTTVLPRNLHKWQQLHSQPMAVWIITNSENAFLDASYMLRVTKSQRPSNTQTLYRVIRSLRTTSSRSTFNKKRTEFIIRLKNRGYPYSCMFKPVLRNESPESFSAGEKVTDNRRTQKKIYIAFWNAISSSFAKPYIWMGKWHLKTNPCYHIAKEYI